MSRGGHGLPHRQRLNRKSRLREEAFQLTILADTRVTRVSLVKHTQCNRLLQRSRSLNRVIIISTRVVRRTNHTREKLISYSDLLFTSMHQPSSK
jgi:hypothetical protein